MHRRDQEAYWAGSFGDEYIDRNRSASLLATNLSFFARALSKAHSIRSCIEFGANVGMNLQALQSLYPGLELAAIEINERAAGYLKERLGPDAVFTGSINDFVPPAQPTANLCLAKTVLIHINPEDLASTYDKMYQSTSQYILVGEYYAREPVAISYRGVTERLWKRDFAGEMLDRFPQLRLVDYGFFYHRDPGFTECDDISWFLMEKVTSPAPTPPKP